MLLTVTRVRDGRQGIPRQGRSWPRVAREAWGTDILHERSYLWLLGSRLFFLMAGTTLVGDGVLLHAGHLRARAQAGGRLAVPRRDR